MFYPLKSYVLLFAAKIVYFPIMAQLCSGRKCTKERSLISWKPLLKAPLAKKNIDPPP